MSSIFAFVILETHYHIDDIAKYEHIDQSSTSWRQ